MEGTWSLRGFSLVVIPYYFCHTYPSKQVECQSIFKEKGNISTLDGKTYNKFVAILYFPKEVRK